MSLHSHVRIANLWISPSWMIFCWISTFPEMDLKESISASDTQ